MKYLLIGAATIAAVLLLTSDKAVSLRKDLEDKAKDNADKWKDKLATVGNSAGKRLSELKDLMDTEMEGLSDDARGRIKNVLDGASNGAKKFKKSMA